MLASISTLLVAAVALTSAIPVVEQRAVTELNQGAFEEAQQRDDTATREFSSVPITVRRFDVGDLIRSNRADQVNRHPLGTAYPSTCLVATSEQTWLQSKLLPAMEVQASCGTLSLKGNTTITEEVR